MVHARSQTRMNLITCEQTIQALAFANQYKMDAMASQSTSVLVRAGAATLSDSILSYACCRNVATAEASGFPNKPEQRRVVVPCPILNLDLCRRLQSVRESTSSPSCFFGASSSRRPLHLVKKSNKYAMDATNAEIIAYHAGVGFA
mmetsp:Transcript_82562/g.130016  ORF Transcript_82562/g.130016 Transcript_82562/m.130016 type:complete len:146 (+) Transcript_82562:79-516(+)